MQAFRDARKLDAGHHAIYQTAQPGGSRARAGMAKRRASCRAGARQLGKCNIEAQPILKQHDGKHGRQGECSLLTGLLRHQNGYDSCLLLLEISIMNQDLSGLGEVARFHGRCTASGSFEGCIFAASGPITGIRRLEFEPLWLPPRPHIHGRMQLHHRRILQSIWYSGGPYVKADAQHDQWKC